MFTTRKALAVCCASLLIGCDRRTPAAEALRDSPVVTQGPAALGLEPLSCEPRPGGLRVSATSIGQIPVDTRLQQLRELCPRARVDRDPDAHDEQLALRIDYPGASVRATFQTSAGDPHDDAAPMLWTVRGDSVRFPDGTLVPRTIGALRQLDSLGSMMASDNDLAPEESFVVLCRHPELIIDVAGGVRRPAEGSPWPFRSVAPDDSARVLRVSVIADAPKDGPSSWWRDHCP